MDTTRILAFRHPCQLALLMDSLVASAVHLPDGAGKVAERSVLPSTLQRVTIRADKTRTQWRAWLSGSAVILLTAEYTASPSTHPKSPTLRLSLYGSQGRIKDRSDWLYLPTGNWQRLRSSS